MPSIVLQLRSGDEVKIHAMFYTRESASQYIAIARDSPSSWWKIMDFYDSTIQPNYQYTVIVRVNWETSNRVSLVGVYRNTPAYQYDEFCFTETLHCEN